MKRLLSFVIIFIFFSCSSFAQKFLHYYLNDSSYHGFYTDIVDSIVNDTYSTIIYIRGQSLQISLSNIDSVVVEACSIDEDTSIDYRIYEFNVNNDEYPFRKVIADNRASLFISKNGSFAGNDTVLIHSLYYGAEMFCCLDSLGRVRELYDTLNVVLFHYLEDSCLMIVFNKNDSTWQEYYVSIDSLDAPLLAKTINPAPFFKRIGKVGKELFRLRGNASTDLAGIIASIGGSEMMKNVELLRDAYDRPDNWGGRIFVDALGITKDVIGILASIAAEPFSGGMSTAVLLLSCGSLMYDAEGLVNDIFPDEERMQRYTAYYKDYFGISLNDEPATDITCNSAILHGMLHSSYNGGGTLNFFLVGGNNQTLTGSVVSSEENTTYEHPVVAYAEGLEPGMPYMSFLQSYTTKINGMPFVFYGETQGAGFYTQETSIATGNVISQTDNSLTVEASFNNICSGHECGIMYREGSGDTVSIPVNTEGSQTITINGLHSCQNIEFWAYYKRSTTETVHGESRFAMTSSPSAVGPWTMTVSYSNNDGSTSQTSYAITLNSDGSATMTNFQESYVSASWSAGCSGINISIMILATATNNAGIEISATYDNAEFTHLYGSYYTWTYNQVGYHNLGGHSITLSR